MAGARRVVRRLKVIRRKRRARAAPLVRRVRRAAGR